MALTRIFGGTNLYVPGAYDTKNVILTGGAPSVAVGKVAIIGEASKGRPGSVEILQFSPEAMRDLISEYGSGPIVDAARMLSTPSNDARIRQGASSIYVYKTNPSTKASLALATAWGQVDSIEYGQEANLISIEIEKTNAVDASALSSAAFSAVGPNFGSGMKFSMRVNGGAANLFTAPAGISTKALLLAALQNAANWSAGLPAGITFVVNGSDAAAIVSMSQDALALDNRLGAGRSFELIAGSPDLLAPMSMSAGLKKAISEPKIRFVASRQSDSVLEDSDDLTGDIGGAIYLEIGYNGTSAALTINSTQLQTIVVGGSGASLALNLANFRTINDLAAYIAAQVGYSCSVPAEVNGGLTPTILDRVVSIGIASSSEKSGRIKADAFSLFDYIRKNSALVAIPNTGSRLGLPDALIATFLSGAVRGASANSDFINALAELEMIEDIDLIIPLVSQDALDDIAENAAYTDSNSAYTVDSIALAVKNHCKKMSSVKARKERACYLGKRETFGECINKSRSLNSEFASMLIQDVSILGTDGNLFWGQPHLAAAMCAGMQAGAEIGQPTTKKLVNAVAIRHVGKQGIALAVSDRFAPQTKADQCIDAGIMPLNNPSSGGVEIMVQNATYSKDSNFVYNRPSVFSAMNYLSKVMRKSLEDKFVGEKNKTSTVAAIRAEVIAMMSDFLRSDIIVGDDSNGGLGYKDLTLLVEGNAVFINVTVTVVQGIDFILSNISVDNIRIAA